MALVCYQRLLQTLTTGLLLIVIGCPATYAQDLKLVAPKKLESNAKPIEVPTDVSLQEVKSSDPQRIILKRLTGLIFLRTPEKVLKNGINMEGILTDGYMPESFFKEMNVFLNEPLSLEKLNDMLKSVVVYFRSQSTPVVDVYVPEQDITGGTIQIVVREGHVGEIRVEGNEWFESEMIAKQVRAKPGDPIRGNMLAEDINKINKNPFRRVDLVLIRGEEQGKTDVVLRTEDRFPLRLYGGYENTGTGNTGYDRYFAGLNWGNAFGLGHLLDYQFTSSDNYKSMNAHSLHYELPISYRQTINFFAAYAESNPNLDPYDLEAESFELSARYILDLDPTEKYLHSVFLGVDYKFSNSNLGFSASPVFNKDVEILQVIAGYNGSLPDGLGMTAFNLQAVVSPGNLLRYNTDEYFNNYQEGASADYLYCNLDIDRLTTLPFGFALSNKAHGQLANGQLLGSEQIGLGGYSTIRGFPEREVNIDSGLLLRNEILTPSLSLADFMNYQKDLGMLQLLAFWDYGFGRNDYIDRNETLSGYGLGLRYNFGSNISLHLDYGIQDCGKDIALGANSRLHLGLVIAY
ncbi:ShlB/FhaC/HecB family hemolysin secretion/activation protein [Desulfotalea psychrophila]|uniref:Uncharacterized protein n=1 Tax=Desulfotalea psychrophila (strain LSv54 / DSM 12343) TaxID=177439 RepID=Q6AIC9_DESPS|nr:ShlB/FhaC/HecB family hemolysin secretion/activation protein [Desulfotalea psychrophila]CAG37918.1 conserved hypothetical protein [Desulfotalea psychrophila LSv54]